MKITLKQWKQLERRIQDMQRAAKACEHEFLCMAIDHQRDGNVDESDFLAGWANRITAAIEELPVAYSFHCQSEWMGGDSSDPKSHVLKEPHATGNYHKRRFTTEEIAEAGAKCFGPCHWEYESEGGAK